MTPAEMAKKMAEQEATIAQLSKQLEQAQQNASGVSKPVQAIIKKYGKGTVSIENVNRFPISLHPAQLPRLATGVEQSKILLQDVKNQNELRCSAYAYEYAMVATGLSKKKGADAEIPRDASSGQNKSPERLQWERAWDAGYAIALADKDAVPASKKYVNPATVVAAWQ